MGFLDAGYALFEFTGQKILDFYDILSSAPAIVKIFQNNTTKVYYCSLTLSVLCVASACEDVKHILCRRTEGRRRVLQGSS